jgi:predicted NBD/HSP70 family sugar kinase
VDLGGTAVNYTLVTQEEEFLIEGLCEHPARAREGPEVCLQQIVDGLKRAVEQVGLCDTDVAVAGLDTPGPASAAGVLSAEGSTNFVHRDWGGFDIRGSLSARLGIPVTYLNDGNAGALWGHFNIFGTNRSATSVTVVIGTGLGGGVIIEGRDIKGRKGFGGELGHVLLPYQNIRGIEGLVPECNCGRIGDLESVCSLTAIGKSFLPYFLPRYPDHELGKLGNLNQAAKLVRGLAEKGDPMCKVGGGAIETSEGFQRWFIAEIHAGMPPQREEQADIPIYIMPNGDTAGARGAAIEALQFARANGLL